MPNVDYKNFFRIFLCTDVEDLKARLSLLALECIESRTYYECGDSWIENEKLKDKVLDKILSLQEELLYEYRVLIDNIDIYGDILKNFEQQRSDDNFSDYIKGYAVVTSFIQFLETKINLEKAQHIYHNYPKVDENDKSTVPYNDLFIKRWLKKITEDRA